jgi:hypothetical protein
MNDFLIDCFFKECCVATNFCRFGQRYATLGQRYAAYVVLDNGPALCRIALENVQALCDITLDHFAKSVCVGPVLCGVARDQSSTVQHSAEQLSNAM